ncbi:S41 family peptidase [Streptomyces litchfieldiae]|uniref:S41 family peptidase n=1 Tax=Streptomyces litchfieldiae TaxID=3075543 RepID=A0ABU2MUU3_9ACTN|nr:S41 family peptidase [Streptomyces sp. DSM 44938]MDT0345330.1 S41 family peptidase [Streptomyces sp. DSM 44938]
MRRKVTTFRRSWRRRWPRPVVTAVLVIAISGSALTPVRAGSWPAEQDSDRPAPCVPASQNPPPLTPTTVGTVRQAYYCILDEYADGTTLDHRELLAAAFSGFAGELHRQGQDLAAATLPAFTGDRDEDLAAFSEVYQRVTDHLPDDPALRQALGEATIHGMVTSLHDNHAAFSRSVRLPNAAEGEVFGLGFATSPTQHLAATAPDETTPPVFVTEVFGGPAAAAGLRPGDVILSVNGSAPFAGDTLSPGVMDLLYPSYPSQDAVELTVRRPATGTTWAVTLRPDRYRPDPATTQPVTSRLLPGGVAYLEVRDFRVPGTADRAIEAITDLGAGAELHGVVIDVRGAGGGRPDEVARLLSAFVHDETLGYTCDQDYGDCEPLRTDDDVALLGLPLAVLTDRNCPSACDMFSAAVQDLDIGTLVGTRTSGLVSGGGRVYQLDDGSQLMLPKQRVLGPLGEMINEIGVAPDHHVPLVPEDLSTGRDPALDRAVESLLAEAG